MLGHQAGLRLNIISWSEVRKTPALLPQMASSQSSIIGVFDPQTWNWMGGRETPERVPGCWQFIGQLEPQSLGLGNRFSDALLDLVTPLPDIVSTRLSPRLRAMAQPLPASLYRVDPSDPWCRAR